MDPIDGVPIFASFLLVLLRSPKSLDLSDPVLEELPSSLSCESRRRDLLRALLEIADLASFD
jgi:hypothetical protein